MSRVRSFLASLALFLLAAQPAPAHHTYVTKYDSAKLIDVSGIVSSVSFTNPHIFFTVDAGSKSWIVETESLSVANAKGLKASLLKEGAKVKLKGWPARDGSPTMGLKSITFPGGPTILMRGTAR